MNAAQPHGTADRGCIGPPAGPPPFDLAPFIERLGAGVVAAARRVVDDAPPLTAEQTAQIRAVVRSAPRRTTSAA